MIQEFINFPCKGPMNQEDFEYQVNMLKMHDFQEQKPVIITDELESDPQCRKYQDFIYPVLAIGGFDIEVTYNFYRESPEKEYQVTSAEICLAIDDFTYELPNIKNWIDIGTLQNLLSQEVKP